MLDEFFAELHWTHLLIIPSMLLAFTVHELAHALAAYYLGDRSQLERGMITINPLKHISWFGSVAFLITGYFGWPKALAVNPHYLRQQYLGLVYVALAGPLASATLCLFGLLMSTSIAAFLVTFTGATTEQVIVLLFPVAGDLPEALNIHALAVAFVGYLFVTNFWLTVTSLIPLPGFDGFMAIVSLVVHIRERNNPELANRPSVNQPDRPVTLIKQSNKRRSIAEIHFNIGVEFHEKEQFEDAIARYRQALQNNKHFGPAYINMGLAYLAKERRQDALHAFRGAVQFAEDRKSQEEGWQQIRQLSEVSITADQTPLTERGADPWVDTSLQPNWLELGVGAVLVFAIGTLLYIFLIIQLAHQLAAG